MLPATRLCLGRQSCLGTPEGDKGASAVATYAEGEAVELLTRAAAAMPGNEHHPARAAAAVALVEAHGLRLTGDESQLEGAQEDTYYQPRPGESRPRRSALAVLVQAIIQNM